MDPISIASISAAGISPGSNVGNARTGSTDYDRSLTYVNDALNYSIGNGANLMDHEYGRQLMAIGPSMFGRKETQDFIDSIAIFNQRPDVQEMSPERRIDTFFTLKHNNANVEGIKSKLRKIGYDAKQKYRDTPDVSVQEQQQVTASKK